MGLDVKQVAAAGRCAPPQRQMFQPMLFSKIVPNCKKLGLLDADGGWLRTKFTELGVIQFEDGPTPARSTRCSSSPRARSPAEPSPRLALAGGGRHPRHGRHARVRSGRARGRRARVPRAVGGPDARPDDRHRGPRAAAPGRAAPPSSRSTPPPTWRRATTSAGPAASRRLVVARHPHARRDRRAGRSGRRRAGASDATDPDLVALVPAFLDSTPSDVGRAGGRRRFAVGDRVTVRRMAPAGHHRCPRYVRGVTGEVVRAPGGWPPPGRGGRARGRRTPCGSPTRDLWGDDAEPGDLFIDLWERYLT